MVHFSGSSVFLRFRRHRKRILLGTSQKNGRFRRLQDLLPQKLEGFADLAEISDFVRAHSFGTFLFSAGCLLFLVGFKILFLWCCLPKPVGLEGFLLLELEGFADFERILVLMTAWLDRLVFKLEPTKPSEIGRPILLEMENFVCEVYWFQNSAVVY